jgi:hypothetical protein
MAAVENRAAGRNCAAPTLQSLVAGTQDSRLTEFESPEASRRRRDANDDCRCAAILGGISNLTQHWLWSTSRRAADLGGSPTIEPAAEAIHVNIDHWGCEERQQL